MTLHLSINRLLVVIGPLPNETYVITAPPFRLGDTAGPTALAADPTLLFVVTVVTVEVMVLLAGGDDSDFGDPFDVIVELLLAFVEVELIAVELRTLTDVRLLLALDGGGG